MNKKLGNDFEHRFCELLSASGYWVHNMTQNSSGQPADIIAVKNGEACLIDCKVCSNDVFKFSRIEENQHYAMRLWKDCGNIEPWFALETSQGIYMIPYSILEELSKNSSELRINSIQIYGVSLERWV